MAQCDSGCEDNDSLPPLDAEPATNLNRAATDIWYEKATSKRNLVLRRTLSDSLIDLGSLKMRRSKHDDKEVMSEDEMHVETVVTAETRAKIDEYVMPSKKHPLVEGTSFNGDVGEVGDVSMESAAMSDDNTNDITADTVVMEELANAESVATEQTVQRDNNEIDFNAIERHPDYKKVEFYHGAKRARLLVILNHLLEDDD